MQTTASRLEEWQRAGLLTLEQVAAIDRYERGRPAEPGGRRTVFAEAVGYVGAALAIGAVALLVGEFWTDLTTAAQLVLVGTLTLALLGSGLALRHVDRPALQRLVSVLWLGAVIGVAWFVALLAGDLGDLEEARLALTVGGAALVVAGALYALRRRALAQLAVLASLVVVALAALSLPDLPPQPGWYGLTVVGIGLAWFTLGRGGWLVPARVAEVTGTAVAVFACQVPWEGREWLLPALGVAIAAGLIWLAVVRDAFPFLVVGALGLFQLVPRLVFELFGEAIGGAASMLVVGLLLVLVAVGLGRAGREIRRGPDLAAVLVVAVVALTLVFGVQRPPALAGLVDQPTPAPPEAVAWTGWRDQQTCLHVADPTGGVTTPWCSSMGGEVAGWSVDGELVLRSYDGGGQLRTLDPVSGSFTGRLPADEDLSPAEGDVVWSEREAGELVVRDLASDAVLWRVAAPERYRIESSRGTADGRWIVMVDSAERLLVLPSDGSLPPRVWAGDVPAWPAPVWESTVVG